MKRASIASALKERHEMEKSRKKHLIDDEFEPANFSLPTATELLMLELRKHLQSNEFLEKFPPIVLVHQLFSTKIIKEVVMRELNDLETSGKAKLIIVGKDLGVVLVEDLENFVAKLNPSNKKVLSFCSKVFPETRGSTIEKAVLYQKYGFTAKDIADLVHHGLLVIQNEKKYQFSSPGVGVFLKLFRTGKNAILKALKKTKYKELLTSDLMNSSVCKELKFNLEYHVAELIGAEDVTEFQTTSGQMLHLNVSQV